MDLFYANSQDSLFFGLAIVSLLVAIGVLVAFLVWNRAMQRRAQAVMDGDIQDFIKTYLMEFSTN